MTKYFMLTTSDSLPDVWVFREGRAGKLSIRSMYARFACPSCGKIDEAKALGDVGLPVDLALSPRADVQFSLDGWLVLKNAVVTAWEAAGVKGVDVVAQNAHVSVVVPAFVGVDETQYESTEPCAVCGRPSERYRIPPISSMELPTDRMVVFGPRVPSEGVLGVRHLFFLSEDARKLIRKSRGALFDWVV